MLRVFTPLILIIIFVTYNIFLSDKVENLDGYPLWIQEPSGLQTDQTSGLCYLGKSGNKKVFLDCDDIGRINKISIDEGKKPPAIEISEVMFSQRVSDYFYNFPRKDYEEIFYDKYSGKIYLSIEGNNSTSTEPPDFKNYEGIYELTFNKDYITFDSILTVNKLNLPPSIFEYTRDNVAFEGASSTEKYFYFGLENFQSKPNGFTDSTYLYIVNKNTLGVKTISTKKLKIKSISGLYAKNDRELFGIDRDSYSMFKITFNPDFDVYKTDIGELDLPVPGHKDITGVIGILPESITFDDENNIYVAIDPLKEYYTLQFQDKKKLTQKEINNFLSLTPIIYKYKNPFR